MLIKSVGALCCVHIVLQRIFTGCLHFDLPYGLIKIRHNSSKYSAMLHNKMSNTIYLYIPILCHWSVTLSLVCHISTDVVKRFAYEPSGPPLITDFCNMKQLRVFLFPSWWDASPAQCYPQHNVCRYLFIHLGGERHFNSEVFWPRTKHNVPSQSLNLNCSIWRWAPWLWGTLHPTTWKIFFLYYQLTGNFPLFEDDWSFVNCRVNYF